MVSRTQKNVIALRDIEQDTKRNVPGGYAGLNEEGVLSLETIPEEVKNPGSNSGLGDGDVVGPSSSIVNEIAVFSDTTGKVLKSSGVKYTDFITSTTLTATLSNYATTSSLTILTNTVNTKLAKTGGTTSGFYQSSLHNIGGVTNGMTIKPLLINSNFKQLENGGNFTLQAPDPGNYSMVIVLTPGVNRGTMTTVGFTKVTGELNIDTINLLFITAINNKIWLTIVEG